MKEGWETVRLADLCSIKSGRSDTKDAAPDGEYAFFDRSKTIKRSNRYLFDCEALVLPGEGTEFLPRHVIGRFDLHQRAYALFDFSPLLDVKFLYHLLHHRADYFPAVAVGATVKSLRLRHFEEFPVILPPLPEQERIVRILDEALAATDEARANTQTVVGLRQELVESHLNDVMETAGEEYQLVALSSALSSQPRNGWSPPASQHAPSGTPVLTLSAVTGFHYRGDKVKYTSANPPRESHCWLANGDLLITRSNTPKLVGHVAIYDGTPDRVIYPDLIMRMRTDETRLLTEFAYYWIRTRRSREYLMSMAGGASQTMSKITKAHVQNLPIALPPIDVQARSVELIQAVGLAASDLSANQRATAGELAKLRAALLDRAFSGAL